MKSFFGNLTSALGRCSLLLVIAVLLPIFGINHAALAAERVYASYSVLERSISVSSLENYARKGIIGEDLAVYTQYLQPEQLEELRQVLLSPIKVNAVAVSQFLYTPQGEFFLRRLAQVIRTQSGKEEPGFLALRSGLILASSEPEGLTLLNLLRKYPSPNINIDISRTLGIAAELGKLVNETDKAIIAVSQQSEAEASNLQKTVNFSRMPDLKRKGRFPWKQYSLKQLDTVRGRFIATDVYLPSVQAPAPVIVISHGIGTDSSNFTYLASHLASHGFVVVLPNHPGSDTKQLSSLLGGRTNEVAEAKEFIERPLDVKYILDHLERLNQSDPLYKGRMNMQQVGVFGQSFGGYTALALAGAKLNFEELQQDCNQQALKDTWNVSLLLQCRVLDLAGTKYAQQYDLHDKRVKSVIAVNPISSSIFGEESLSQVSIPVMIVASSDDTVAPAVYEQILPFSWIGSSDKYLVMLKGGTHFSVIGNGKTSERQLALPSEVIGDDPAQARRYMQSLTLPFFESYAAGTSKYLPYLNAAYAKKISSQPIRLSLIKTLSITDLAQVLGDNFRKFKR
jgi:predicted dienelactone hydrolase